MARTKYDNKWTQAAGDVYTHTLHNAEQDGIQREFEERTQAVAPALEVLGTVSMAIDAINDKVDITVAASSALFVAGIRYESLASITFAAQVTGTYRLYVNNTTETTGSIISSSALPANSVQIGTVDWTLATTTLSNLVSWIPSPMTTLGDTLYAGNGGSATRLAGNTATRRKFYRQTGDGSNSAAPAWDTLVNADVVDITTIVTHNVRSTAHPDSNAGAPVVGDLFYGHTVGSSTLWDSLPIGTGGKILAVVGGLPAWVYPTRHKFFGASEMWPSTTSGCAALAKTEVGANKINIQTLDFAQGGTQYAEWAWQMPGSWDAGTITFQAIWTAASGAGTVAWNLEAMALADGDAIDTAWPGFVGPTDTLIATNDLQTTPESSAITVGNSPAAGKYVQFRVTRKGSDTLTATAKLMGIRITYAVNTYTDA